MTLPPKLAAVYTPNGVIAACSAGGQLPETRGQLAKQDRSQLSAHAHRLPRIKLNPHQIADRWQPVTRPGYQGQFVKEMLKV